MLNYQKNQLEYIETIQVDLLILKNKKPTKKPKFRDSAKLETNLILKSTFYGQIINPHLHDKKPKIENFIDTHYWWILKVCRK